MKNARNDLRINPNRLSTSVGAREGSPDMKPGESNQAREKLLLRPLEAAVALGVGRSTVYELMRAGEFPIVRIGRAVRIPTRALEAWVEQRAASGRGL